MIGTKKFTNNLEARYDELLKDPVKWAIMRNLAYASIRDDVEKVIKHTNENSADVYINAENLIQNLKRHNIIQDFENLEGKQFKRSKNNVIFKTKHFNYEQNDLINSDVKYLIYELKYGDLGINYILMLLLNIENLNVRNDSNTRAVQN